MSFFSCWDIICCIMPENFAIVDSNFSVLLLIHGTFCISEYLNSSSAGLEDVLLLTK